MGEKVVNKELDIWDGFWNTGEAISHNQSFGISYELPFKLFPIINFISSSYNYTGDFNWERGSDAMALVEDEIGNVLGRVNTVQNSNSQSFTVSFNMSKLYRNLNLQKKKKPKTSAERFKNSLIGFVTGLSRFKLNYSENNGKVLPGYLETLGFLGTSKPSLGFVFGSQSDIRYQAAKNGWLTSFPSFNEQYTQVHNTKFDVSAEISWIDDLKISEEKQTKVIRAIDKLDKPGFGLKGVEDLLKKERKDQSGAITKGADLSNEQAAQILNFLKIKDLKKLKETLKNPLSQEVIQE